MPQEKIRKETLRQLVHILSFLSVPAAIVWGTDFALLAVALIAVIYSVSEYLRMKNVRVPFVAGLIDRARRTDESEGRNVFATAPLLMTFGILMSFIIFPPPVSYAAIVMLTLGDGISTIVGKVFGRIKIKFSSGKTVEGTLVGFAFGLAGAMLFVHPVLALIAAVVGTVVELIPWRLNDNITVPLLSGLSVMVAQVIF